MDDLLADFLTETAENLAELDVALVRLERTPDDAATLSLIFRLVHTIKGTCGFLGLPRLERVAHAAENVLGQVRDGVLVVTADVVTQVLLALDRVKLILAGLSATEAEPPGDDSELIAALERVVAGNAQPRSPPQPRPFPPRRPSAHRPLGQPRPLPPLSPSRPGPHQHRPHQHRPHWHRPHGHRLHWHAAAPEPGRGHPPPANRRTRPSVDHPPAAAGAQPNRWPAQQTIRVSVEVLENLMTLVSELVLTRNQLLQMARGKENSDFATPLQRLSHITVGSAGRRHEDAHAADRQRLEQAAAHRPRSLARNRQEDRPADDRRRDRTRSPGAGADQGSADPHGAQFGRPRAGMPAERRAAGKPETGQIILNAYHEGGHIIIEIADDGRGLPVDRIRQRCSPTAWRPRPKSRAMTDQQIHHNFRAGFSTAARSPRCRAAASAWTW